MISDIKKRALHRTKILQGQLRGLEKMIEKEEYCMDILTQSLAVQKSLSSLDKLIVENHIKTHVSEAYLTAKEEKIEGAMQDLMNLYEIHKVRGR